MNKSMAAVSAPLNRIISELPKIDKTDLSALATIIGELEKITGSAGIPKAMATQAGRAISLANNIIMCEIDFKTGCKKLSDCIAKMRKSADVTSGDAADAQKSTPEIPAAEPPDPAPQPRAEEPVPVDVDDDIKELVVKFASSQQAVLEDFEAYILEFDKGDPLAKSAIQRVLHTWKGEFGVLDLSDYSKFIHEIEDRIEQNDFSIDNLFKLKDLLAGKFAMLANGKLPTLSNAEKNHVGDSPSTATIKEEPIAAAVTKPVETASTPESTGSIAPSVETPPAASIEQQTTTADILSCDTSLLNDFITESRDHLHTAETLLLELETDPENKENLNSIFRAWHTIKGIAGFLGLREVSSLAHKMESQMDLARKGELLLGPGPIDAFLEANDCLKNLVQSVETALKGGEYVLPERYAAILNRMIAGVANEPTTPTVAAPSADKKIGEILVETGKASPEEIDKALEKQASGDTRKIGEILLEETAVPARDVGNALATQSNARQLKGVEETIRVPVNRIDQLVDSIGEAVIAQSMVNASTLVTAAADQALITKIAHANSILRQIQELAMSLRMVSIKSTFQKMARLARDLSKKCGRDIEFITEGEDTELDKSVVENIGDPLIHMIRNSIDHGIEPPEERSKTGKPLKAIVKLRAFHRAGSIFIEVIDDGKGLNREAIYEKAVNKGLCKADATLTDQEIFQFIFLPGFSTAKVVTDVSGRGVGMDVVRRNIEALRGSVEISSTPGKGTTFSIRLPLTLAIVDGMVVRSGRDRYIIPTLAILESIKAKADLISSVLGSGKLIKVRNELIPLVHLGGVLQRSDEAWDMANGIVMIVEDMLGKKIGLFLDEIIGQQQVVIKSLGDGMGDIPGVTGGAIMSDGTVCLILDVGGVVKLSGENQRGEATEAPVEELVAG
jgi:two-component system chemotaxis sensor kinase CheA